MTEDLDHKSLDELTDLLKTLPITHPMVFVTAKSLATSTCSTQVRSVVAKHHALSSHFVSLIHLENETPLWIATQDPILQLFVNLSSTDLSVSSFLVKRICMELGALDRLPDWTKFSLVDKCFAILSNLTSRITDAQEVFELLGEERLRSFLSRFDAANRDRSKPHMQFFPSLLVNLSRLPEFRQFLMDDERYLFQRLIPFTDTRFPVTIRGAIMRLIRNCSFNFAGHPWLLSEKVGLLTYLLLPLAGPEEFDEEDNAKLPIDLQYLPEDKERESVPELRIILLESVLQLCCTRFGRQFLRDNGAYFILRELHKWEKDVAVRDACEKVVDLLINDEPVEAMQNLRNVEVPEHLTKQFEEMDIQVSKTT